MTQIKNRKSISNGKKYFDDLYQNGYTGALDYQQVLFKPGKVVQSRELNFLQSLLHEKIKSGNDLTYKNGSVIMGCDIEVLPDELETHVEMDVVVGDGIVYWDGTFFKFFSDSDTFDYSDDAYIFLVVKYETIDYVTDTKLNDPAIIYKIGKAINGADRLKVTFEIKLKTSANADTFDSENIQSFVIGTFKNGVVSLNNRNPIISEEPFDSESKVVTGLKVRSNPMREVFTLNDDNDDFYNTDGVVEKAFVEIEEGSAIVKGKEVVSSESKVFTFNKSLSSGADNKQNSGESKEVDFKNIDAMGIYGDISYGSTEIDQKTFLFDMIQPGKRAKIKIRIPLTKTVGADVTTEYQIFEVCEAEIADMYELWKEEQYKNSGFNIGDLINKDFNPVVINPLPNPDIFRGGEMIELPHGFKFGNLDYKPGANYTPIELNPVYDTTSDWYAECLVFWKINLKNDSSSWDVREWESVNCMIILNKLYDAAGKIVDTSKGVTISMVNINKSSPLTIQSRTNSAEIDIPSFEINSNIFSSLPGTVPATPSVWMNPDTEDVSSCYKFEVKFSDTFMKDNELSSTKSVIAYCANPFCLPGNILTVDNAPIDMNVFLKHTLRVDSDSRIILTSNDINRVIIPASLEVNNIKQITFNIKEDENIFVENNYNNIKCLNISSSEYYRYSQSSISSHILSVEGNDYIKLISDYTPTQIDPCVVLMCKFSITITDKN